MKEQLIKFKSMRKACHEKITALLNLVSDEGRSLSEDESEQLKKLEGDFDSHEEMIEKLERSIEREERFSKDSKAPRIKVIREDKEDDEGNYRGYSEFNKGGYGEFLRDVQRAERFGKRSEKLEGLQKWAASGMNEAVGSEGGFLVQPDHVDELFGLAISQSMVAPHCREVQTDKGSIVLNAIDETSRVSGSRYGGVRAYRRAEAGSVTATKPKFRREEIKADALEAVYYATDEQLEDVPQLNSLVAPMFAAEIGWKLDDEIIGGTGAGGQCLGIINSPGVIEVAKESGQTADTLVAANIKNMFDRLLPSAKKNAKWFYNAECVAQLREMTHTPGSLTDFMLWIPGSGGILGHEFDTLGGKEAIEIEQCRALGDVGDIVLGDWNQYLLVRRRGIEASQSAHVAFLTSETCFKLNMRVGGQPFRQSAITPAYGSVTKSDFVSLAARA